ncbi:MAG: YheU family protein [Pseudomonadota bacterium]
MTALKIPFDQLSPEALNGIIQEFVTRDGTDYGEVEVPLETKVSQVLRQIQTGRAVIVFDQESGTCTILRGDDPGVKNLGP